MTDPGNPPQKRDIWEKIQVAAIALAAVALPIVIAIIGNAFSSSMKEKELRMKTVEIAINVLSQDPKANTSLPSLREWAVSVINNYSGIPLSNQARKELLNNPLPSQAERALSHLLEEEWKGGGFVVESQIVDYKILQGNADVTSDFKRGTVERPILAPPGIQKFRVIVDGKESNIVIPIKKGRVTKIIIGRDGISTEGPFSPAEVLHK